MMFEQDRSAARGLMSTRGLYVFRHDSKLGNAHAHRLFDAVGVERNGNSGPARKFSDFAVTVDDTAIPDGVRLERHIG